MRAAGDRNAARCWDRRVALFTEHEGMRGRASFFRVSCGERTVHAFLHQVICKVDVVSHGPPPELSG